MVEHIQVSIEEIDDKSQYLDTVIKLGDANKATLSFFPKGAFHKHAIRRQIIVALENKTECIGYLLYDVSSKYNRVKILHLCIAPSHQGKGVARQLVDYLIKITKQYTGIGLTCRRDYGLDSMWTKLNFVAQYNKPAKTIGKESTYWWLDHGHPNLFSNAANEQREHKYCVVLDDNIFFNFLVESNVDNEESKFLLADWLQPELDLCLTDEIFNKINSISNIAERKKQNELAEKFTRLPCNREKLENVYQPLSIFLREKEIFLDDSSIRHLARTIASDIHCFVTNDARLLNIASEIYNQFKLSVCSPISLINNFDELSKNSEYEPVRLAGTSLKQTRIKTVNKDSIGELCQYFQHNEIKAEFQQRLRKFSTELDKFECYLITEEENKPPLALIVYGKHKEHELEIPMIRVGESILSATLARHLIFKSISLSCSEQRDFTRITDPFLQEIVKTAIREDKFVSVENGWLRANLKVAETASQLSKRLIDITSNYGNEYNFCSQIAQILNSNVSVSDIKVMADIERFLWPAKIIDADIPTFIIPIQPKWAIHLFDEKLANQTLPILGAKPELAFNREAVYYKSATNFKQLLPPCRILWYVSQDEHKAFCGVGEIRACSSVDEVIIGKPKELHQLFQRFGIYELKDVLNITKGKDSNIMAIRFRDTKLFSSPIPLKTIQELYGKNVTLQAPLKIEKNIFAQLYHLGIKSK